MKKAITICLLVVTLLMGGMTLDAKTTKKKGKSRPTQTSSSQWNGDIPSASFLANTFFFSSDHPNNENILKEHGYIPVNREFTDKCFINEGICEIEYQFYAHSSDITIIIYDSTLRKWLYNDIQRYIKSKGKRSGYSVSLYGNEITFIISKFG